MKTMIQNMTDMRLAELLKPVRGNVGNLFGDYNANARKAIVDLLAPGKNPKSQCGVNRVTALVYRYTGAPDAGSCNAEREDHVISWFKVLTA